MKLVPSPCRIWATSICTASSSGARQRRERLLAEALVLLRERWHMELLYKLCKHDGQLDQWRTGNPWRVLCEVYAKLMSALVVWIKRPSKWYKEVQVRTVCVPNVQRVAKGT